MRAAFIFLFGYCRFAVDRSSAARVLELLKARGIFAHSMKFSGDELFLSVYLISKGAFLRECSEEGIEARLIFERGVPSVVKRYKKRFGIVVGMLLCIAILSLSGTVIWDVRVDGNKRLETNEVLEELRRSGLTVGKAKASLDTDSIQNGVMIASDDISWISINIIGTVAEVQIRESEQPLTDKPPYDAANLVAAKDGVIERFEDTRGNVIAEVGEFVREGELLVSGLYDSKTEGFRYTTAKGRVMARTESEILLTVPFNYEKKVYTGREFTEKYLIFFEKEIKFFGNCGNLPTSCDTIDIVEYCNFFSQGELPIGIRTVKYREYTYERTKREPPEAEALAFSELGEKLSELSGRLEILRKQTECTQTEDSFTLKCKIEAIEDIAKVQEIKIS